MLQVCARSPCQWRLAAARAEYVAPGCMSNRAQCRLWGRLTFADESISIHRWFGKMIGICSLGHFGCHINNYIQLVRICR